MFNCRKGKETEPYANKSSVLACDKAKSIDLERRMQNFLSLVLSFTLLLTLCVLQGCSSTYDYPLATRALKLDHECRDIAGVYRNRGHTKEPGGTEDVYLFDKITNEGFVGTHGCGSCTVTLAWSDSDLSELLVTLHYPSGLKLEEATLKRESGDYTCEDGLVSVGFAEGYEIYIQGGIASGTRKYYLEEGGSLIQKEHATVLAHTWVVIPQVQEYTDYSLWGRAGQHKRSLYLLAMDSDNIRDRRELLCQSAIKGNSNAAAQLGLMYAAGLDGIKADLVESYRLYGWAQRLGQEGATEALILLKKRMTKRQYSEAMRLLEDITISSSCKTTTD